MNFLLYSPLARRFATPRGGGERPGAVRRNGVAQSTDRDVGSVGRPPRPSSALGLSSAGDCSSGDGFQLLRGQQTQL